MPDAIAIFPPGFRVIDQNGNPVASAVIRLYAAGTSTPLTVYSNSGLSASLGSAVYCNSAGAPVASSGSETLVTVYTGTAAYKVRAETSGGVLVWEHDNISGALNTSTFLTTNLSTVDLATDSVTADTTLSAAHHNHLVNANSSGGAFTLTFSSATTLGNGWWCVIRHNGGASANAVNWITTSSQTVRIRGGTATSGSIARGGDAVLVVCDGAGFTMVDISGDVSRDFRLSASAAANALTISVLDQDGNTPSLTKPIEMRLPDDAGADETALVTSALTLTIPSGATLGATANTAFNIWLALFEDAGTLELGVINCRTSFGVHPIDALGFTTATAIGTGADSAGVWYAATAVSTASPYVILGRLEYQTGLSTPGTWSVAPTRTLRHRQGGKLPGDCVQSVRIATGAYATTASAIPFDNTVPQITEGGLVQAPAITPAFAASLLRVRTQISVSSVGGASETTVALFHQSDADAVAVASTSIPSADSMAQLTLDYERTANTLASVSFSTRAGVASGSVGINGTNAQKFGGASNTMIRIEEIMA